MLQWVYVAVPTLVAGYLILKRIKLWWKLPPGPIGLPIVGKFLSVDRENIHLSLNEIADEYAKNGLASVYLGTQLMVVVNDFDVLKEMMGMPVFTGRPRNKMLTKVTEDSGIVFTEGEGWQNQRRLTLHILRDFGFAKTLSQDLVMNEVDTVLRRFQEFCHIKEGVQLANMFQDATNNIICSITFAKSFTELGEEYKRLSDETQALVNEGLVINPALVFPELDKYSITALVPTSNLIQKSFKKLHAYFLQEINERKSQLKSDDVEPLCLLDSYILEQRKAEKKGDAVTYKDMQIIRVCLELFIGGTDTTARSLEWLIIYMAVYPDIQEKVHQEIVDVIGKDKRPQMSDKTQLPFVQAVIDEGFRVVSLAATGLFHRATEDTYFKGYLIPKEATIYGLLHYIHHDPKHWVSPEDFRPERFLGPDGSYKPNPRLVPFQMGRRVCLGESLARIELFLFFTNILQRYQVRLNADSKKNLDAVLKGTYGLVRAPGDYGILVAGRE